MPSSSGSKSAVQVDTARDRDKRIKDSLAESEKLHGKGIVMRRGDKAVVQADAVPTSSLQLDYSIGCGGIPISYITEMFGPEGGGKSTLCLHIIAEANKLGMDALYIDAENSLNLPYAEKLGVDVGRLLICQPDYGEQGFQVAETFIKNGAVGVVVIDSIAMMVPKAEFEGEIGDQGVGLLSRMVTQSLRKLNNEVRKSKVAFICINQVRDIIGGSSWGPTTTTPAGHLLKHAASVRMDIRKVAALKDGDQVVGGRTRIKIVKNRISAPFVECEFDLMYGEGISREAELIDLSDKYGVIVKEGTSYCYKGERLGVGRERARKFLKTAPEMFFKIREEMRNAMFTKS
jgi:recombination protein RecA